MRTITQQPPHTDGLPNTDDLRIFMWVARLSSFTRAAEQLQLPRPTISTAIGRLEHTLGARLLQRTTRRVQMTRDGEQLLERCERLLEDLDELGALFRQHGPQLRGRVRVDMPLGLAADTVLPRLKEFTSAYPELQVDVFSTDRRVDVLSEGLDMVVRVGPIVDESLVSRALPPMQLLNVVSPGYAEQFGLPATIDDLTQHWLINYQPNADSLPAGFDYIDPAGHQAHSMPMQYKVTVNNSVAYDSACRAGLGIAQIPAVRALKAIADGQLLEVLPSARAAPMPMHLLFPHRRNIPRRVRVFAEWLGELIRAAASPQPMR